MPQDPAALTVRVIDLIVNSPKAVLRARLAKNPGCPADSLRVLAGDHEGMVRLAVAGNPNSPRDLLSAMYADAAGHGGTAAYADADFPSADIAAYHAVRTRRAIAANPSADPALLDTAMRDGDPGVRRSACRSPNHTRAHVEMGAVDSSWQVRKAAAASEHLTRRTLRRLARDEDEGVRRMAVGNPRMPLDVVARLERDESSFVRKAAREHESDSVSDNSTLGESQPPAAAPSSQTVPGSPNLGDCGTELLEPDEDGVVEVDDEDVVDDDVDRDEVAASALLDVMDRHWHHALDPSVKVAGPRQLRFESVVGRLDDVASLLRGRLAPIALAYAVASPLTVTSDLEVVLDCDVPAYRALVASRLAIGCDDLPLLTRLADDESPHVRAALARHATASMPVGLWFDLAGDADPDVVAAAAGNPCIPDAAAAMIQLDGD